MKFQKYIIYSYLDAFKNHMVNRSDKNFISKESYEHYTVSKSGKRRAILSGSVKWAKVEGLKNVGVTGLYLSPADTVQGLNTCKFAGKCKHGCIAFTGNLGMFHRQTLENRTLALYHYTEQYLLDMLRELYITAFKARVDGKSLYCRLNGTSDLPFHRVLNMDAIVQDFKGLAGFYDYTKFPIVDNPWESYHLTYSYSERTTKINSQFDRVAIVVTKKDKERLLEDFDFIFTDGDKHDLRPLDNTKYVLLQGKRATATDKQLHNDFIVSYQDCVDMFVIPKMWEDCK